MYRKGFTLIELLLSLALIAGLGVLGVQAFSGYLTRVQITNAYDTLEADLYQAQRFAQEERNNASWGVYFDWGQEEYSIYYGESYDTRIDIYETQSIEGRLQANSLVNEINFVQGEGRLRGGAVGEDIIFSQGTVERRLSIDDMFDSVVNPDRQVVVTEDQEYYPGGIGEQDLLLWIDSTNSQSYRQGNTWFDLYSENHGVLHNQPRYLSDSGGVLDFNANNETYISIKQGHSLDFTQDESMTIMMGIQSDSSNTSEGWIFNFGDWDIFVDNQNNTFTSTIDEGGDVAVGEIPLDLDQWFIGGVELDQSGSDLIMKLYENGNKNVISPPTPFGSLSQDNQKTIFLGSNKDQDQNRFFDGYINPVIGYRRLLNAAEHEILNAYMALTVEDASVTDLFDNDNLEDFGSAIHELIGVGKKDDEEVIQSTSSGGLSLDAPSTSMKNNDMVVATHNNAPLTLTDLDTHKRLQRVWKITSYNFINKNINLDFDFQQFLPDGATVDLIRSDTEDFNNLEVVEEDIYDGNEISVTVNPDDSLQVDGFYTLRFRWE